MGRIAAYLGQRQLAKPTKSNILMATAFVAPTSINAAAGTAIQSGIPVGSTYKWHIRTTVNGCVAASWTDSSVFNVYSIPSNPAISVSNICFGSDRQHNMDNDSWRNL